MSGFDSAQDLGRALLATSPDTVYCAACRHALLLQQRVTTASSGIGHRLSQISRFHVISRVFTVFRISCASAFRSLWHPEVEGVPCFCESTRWGERDVRASGRPIQLE